MNSYCAVLNLNLPKELLYTILDYSFITYQQKKDKLIKYMIETTIYKYNTLERYCWYIPQDYTVQLQSNICNICGNFQMVGSINQMPINKNCKCVCL